MFGRLQLYIIGGILAFGILTGIYYSWRKGIEREALLEYNQQQLEQNVRDQQEMRDKIDAMNKIQKDIESENAAVKKEFKDKMDSINTEIDSKLTVDRAASEVLKKTVTKLKDAVK